MSGGGNYNKGKSNRKPKWKPKGGYRYPTGATVDRGGKLNLFGLTFDYDKKYEQFTLESKSFRIFDLIKIIQGTFDVMNSVNDKGYITKEALNARFMLFISRYLCTKGYARSIFGNAELPYTLWWNYVFLALYYLILKREKELAKAIDSGYVLTDHEEEAKEELGNLRVKVFSRLDQYLKLQVQKRGITVIENTYAAFDTEFELSNTQKNLNTLLSVQTAVQARTLIKVPMYKDYDISYVHPITSEVSSVYKNKVDSKSPYPYVFTGNAFAPVPSKSKGKDSRRPPNEISILNNSLKGIIRMIRDLIYPSLTDASASIIDYLKSRPGATYFDDHKRDQVVIFLPLSNLQEKIEYTQEVESDFTFNRLLDLSKYQMEPYQRETFRTFIESLSMFGLVTELDSCLKFYDKSVTKPRSRTKLLFHPGKQETQGDAASHLEISLSIVRNLYLMAHYNAADLCMLADFNQLKPKISIVNKSFVTLGKPLQVGGTNVYIRDTILLAPAGKSKLSDLGSLYTDSRGEKLDKKEIQHDKSYMSEFLREHRDEFQEYAQRDALITLKHALAMEEFNQTVHRIGIPLTLSSLGRQFVLKAFDEMDKYMPYQISGEYLMGNADEVQTPKGLHATGQVGAHLSYYIANYKGGRNESFMYGVDSKTKYYDYDLSSAYTTGMADLSLPAYRRGRFLQRKALEDLRDLKGS